MVCGRAAHSKNFPQSSCIIRGRPTSTHENVIVSVVNTIISGLMSDIKAWHHSPLNAANN